MSGWANFLQQHSNRFLDELLDFLRIPSISSLSEHAPDVQRAAEWVANRLRAAGIERVAIMPTAGHPVVYGEWLHAPDKPTILIYGHFDTQPVDPVHLWSSPPFEPQVRQGRVYARGANDDKGNMILPILAAEALLKGEGALPVNLKFFFEGEEEIGSPNLPPFIEAHRQQLACDLMVCADGTTWREDQPALVTGFRGLCALQIDIQGPRMDLHSGIYGGTIQNPIHALVQLLDSMHSPEGKILIEGFYDEVLPPTEEERSGFAAVPFDEAQYKEQLGVDRLFGEAGYTTYERAWIRPTLEVNGIWGGFQDEGVKTVLPQEAHAKITCRLAPDQAPDKIVERITAHVEKHAPAGIKTAVRAEPSGALPYLIPPDHPGNRAAHAVLTELYGREPYYTRLGGSLPICNLFLQYLETYTVNFAFALEDENMHSPDEFFRLSSFDRGQEAYCKLLQQLSCQEGL